MKVPKITLDTNCLINAFDPESVTATSVDALEALLSLDKQGTLSIAVTTRVLLDLSHDKNVSRGQRLAEAVQNFPVIGSVFRLDISKLDSPDMVAGGPSDVIRKEIEKLLPAGPPEHKRFVNKIADSDHLFAHYQSKRDLFVTDDGQVLKKVLDLRRLGLEVCSPSDCLCKVSAKSR